MADEPTQQPGLRVVQVYLSTAHFEHGADALSFPPTHKVNVKYGVRVEASEANEGKAGIIKLILATVDEPDSLYRFAVEMTGIVEAENETPQVSVREYITKVGVTMMFPFLREAVANLTSRGRFGALYIKPFNVYSLVPDAPAPERTTAG
ncbi:MAG TPA: protein-export chaperone SecB [Phycisphaerales bacterium]|nr:protein-export chaperone SecB [Phycisphaerales bacterium]